MLLLLLLVLRLFINCDELDVGTDWERRRDGEEEEEEGS